MLQMPVHYNAKPAFEGAIMHDLHVHLDFMANGEAVAADALAAGAMLFANTVTPDGYRAARGRFAGFGNVRVGAGLHPWWVTGEVAAAEAQADELVALLDGTRFVGEVGLDFGARHGGTQKTREAQAAAFTRIVQACAERGGKALSIHSVKAAREVLDILEGASALERCTCIFHWYTGPSDQLKRAIDLGCLFSVGARMAATAKGREYVKAIPARQLLLETDAPPGEGAPYSFAELQDELQAAARIIEAAKGAEALEAIRAHSEELLR